MVKIKKNLKKIFGAGESNEVSREIWIKNTLKKIPSNLSLLDAGAGECQFKKYCSHRKYTSQDFGKYDGKGDGVGLQTKKWDEVVDITSDITNIPVADNFFDAVMCTEVLEHVPDPIAALKEFARLTKKDGYLLITAPFCSATHFSPYHFYSGYNRFFYEKFLPELGYKIIEISPNGNYFEFVKQELLRLPYMSNRYAKKSFNPITYLLAGGLALCLDYFSKKDTGSSEFLNFGYHIYAQKISNYNEKN